MKILITEKQLLKIKKSEIDEKLGVPEGILETGEDLFNDIVEKMREFSTVEELEKGFELVGDYKISDHIFDVVNVGFKFEKDTKYSKEIAGASTHKSSKLSDKFTLQHVDREGELVLIFRIYITPETTVNEIIDLFVNEPERMISTFTHELGHGYYDAKKRGEKSTERSDYQSYSTNNFGDVTPLNEFLFYSYYIHSIENVVRPSELAQLLRVHGINKREFIEFFRKTDMYENLKIIQNYSYEGLRKELKENIDKIKNLFDMNDIDYSDESDEELIDHALELFYVNLANWKGDVMKGILTSNFMEALLGFSGDKEKFFKKYLNNITKYEQNPLNFFKSEIKRFHIVATKMIKKLSKLYDYLTQ